ncbi:MAG: hypothetical protein Q4E50_01700 [Tissierellia bacterium]|nr:hypothetical protein [Tissierellia bacterium]
MNRDFKKKVYLNAASSIMILITIVIIIYENAKKLPRFYSLIGLSISFLLMAAVQFQSYKIDKKKRKVLLGAIYLIIGLANLIVMVIK